MAKNLGKVTAYGYAKSKGYTGTEQEFAELMANYATVGEECQEAAEICERNVNNAGIVSFTIDSDGHLILDKVNSEFDFIIDEDGHLIVYESDENSEGDDNNE